MKIYRKILLTAIASLMVFQASAMAWTTQKQDLTQVDVVIDENVELSDNIPSDWAKSEIGLAIEAGLVPNLTGSPKYQNTINREQFAELVSNMLEKVLNTQIDSAPPDTFIDTTNTAVLKAYKYGIVNGVGDNLFAPTDTTNREQIAAMVFRATEVIKENTGKDLTPTIGSIEKFADKSDISDWAVQSVGELAENGIMQGTSDTTASPKDSCTVEQSILLIYRVYNNAI
jgi:hypothetical protein